MPTRKAEMQNPGVGKKKKASALPQPATAQAFCCMFAAAARRIAPCRSSQGLSAIPKCHPLGMPCGWAAAMGSRVQRPAAVPSTEVGYLYESASAPRSVESEYSVLSPLGQSLSSFDLSISNKSSQYSVAPEPLVTNRCVPKLKGKQEKKPALRAAVAARAGTSHACRVMSVGFARMSTSNYISA